MMDISALVVNVLCELHQIIEEVRKNYVLSKQYNKIIQLQTVQIHSNLYRRNLNGIERDELEEYFQVFFIF
jgi:uncharacterized protein YcfL